IKEALFNLRPDERPAVFGKDLGEAGPLLPAAMEFAPDQIAAALKRFFAHTQVELTVSVPPVPLVAPVQRNGSRVIALAAAGNDAQPLSRKPFFCAGCPHNTSTRLPDGSYAAAGIGCHIMALGEAGDTATFCQMGG
ncbi:hypothetical protein QMO17_28530, partial [Klebsiella pneumoniae]|nr:hypothetical protein [Klebsiella pneumoniae]